MKELKMNKIMLTTIACLSLSACGNYPTTSEGLQNKKQEQMNLQAVESVGMPAITHFQEKRILKDILELRDDTKLTTITYITDLNGRLHKRCDSIGFGIPYATQYTNPMRVAGGINSPSTGNVVIPQADPNGLYSPASAEGTWVLCSVPGKNKVSPTYIEDRITVSTFPLDNN
jgi:hypothetical protein